MDEFSRLYDIIKTLRGENGCAWDKEQSVTTMASSLIEETYELVEAIDMNNNPDLEEELGDLFFLTLFVSYMGEQEGRFEVRKVIQGAADKLVRRHPHVFGSQGENKVDQIIINWETIKRSEKKNQNRKTPFDGIPANLPEIQRFNKVLDKAKKAGLPVDIPSEDDIKASFTDFVSQKEGGIAPFIEDLLRYCHDRGIDLPAQIRHITSQNLKNFLSNP